jgi:hypothetical protein
MKNEIIKGDIEILPTDLFRNIHGGIDAKIKHIKYGEIPTTLSGELLERAESGEFGEIAPLPESQVKRKLINEQQLIIDENLAYLVSTDHYNGRDDEQVKLGHEPKKGIMEALQKRQSSRELIHAARIEIKLLNGETE